MCERGVAELVARISGSGVSSLDHATWEPIADGFSPAKKRTGEPALSEESCPRCSGTIPIIRRTLISGAYNLPDAAVYQRLRRGAPSVALGLVDPTPKRTTMSRRPDERVRGVWQSLMWEVYQVAFVDAEQGRLGRYQPQARWTVGERIPGFADLVQQVCAVLAKARSEGVIPKSNSPLTCKAMRPIIAPILEAQGFGFDDFEVGSAAFWWWHPVDMLYRQKDGGGTLAIEVKVNEDWEHPISQSLAALLAHNAVINMRIPPQGDPLDSATRLLVTEAEGRLTATGRAAFRAAR